MENEAFYGKTCCKLFHPNLWSGPQWKFYINGKTCINTLHPYNIDIGRHGIYTMKWKQKFQQRIWRRNLQGIKDSHNNVWKLDKSLYGSNNLKEHGTKKLNAFREIMDLWQVKYILMSMFHKREMSSFSSSFTSYLDVQWLFKKEVSLKVWNKRFWIIAFLRNWKGIKNSAMSFTSTKSNASTIN